MTLQNFLVVSLLCSEGEEFMCWQLIEGQRTCSMRISCLHLDCADPQSKLKQTSAAPGTGCCSCKEAWLPILVGIRRGKRAPHHGGGRRRRAGGGRTRKKRNESQKDKPVWSKGILARSCGQIIHKTLNELVNGEKAFQRVDTVS